MRPRRPLGAVAHLAAVVVVCLLVCGTDANTAILRFAVAEPGPEETGSQDDTATVERAAREEAWKVLVPSYTELGQELIHPRTSWHAEDGTHEDGRPAAEVWYRLTGLEPYRSYEARISYPAAFPTSFSLEVLGYREAAAAVHARRWNKHGESQESNENAEDVPLPEQAAPGVTRFLRVSAKHEGVSHKWYMDRYPSTPYVIVLESLMFGFLSAQVMRLIGLELVTISIACFVFMPRLWKILERERRGKGKAAE